MGRVFLADPALKDQRGHHFVLTRNISNALIAGEDSVVWLTNQKIEPDFNTEIDSDILVVPTFSVETYHKIAKQKPSDKNNIKKSFLKKLFKRLPLGLQKRIKNGRNTLKEIVVLLTR